ncbi:MAG: response regulator [Candidatus Omnitrophica bacterium]|nr:response regulator [Candidatus Omnitrophota bacterium]
MVESKKKKVMVIDDDKEFLSELKEILELSGYEAISAANALMATDVAVKLKPDIILMDLKMPFKNGFQVADDMKSHFTLRKTPIIAMSGFFFGNEYVQLMEMCGIRKCLKKPFNPVDVIFYIEEALAEHMITKDERKGELWQQ